MIIGTEQISTASTPTTPEAERIGQNRMPPELWHPSKTHPLSRLYLNSFSSFLRFSCASLSLTKQNLHPSHPSLMCTYITSEQSSSSSSSMPLSTAPPSLPNSPFRHEPSLSSSPPRHENDNDITRELKRLRSDLNDLHPDAYTASVVAAAAVDSTASIAVDAIHANALNNNVVITSSASSDEGGIVLPSYGNSATHNKNISTQLLLTSDVATILSKIQEITKIENTIIIHQRDEICKLRCELQLLQQQQHQQQQQTNYSEKMIGGSNAKKSEAPTGQLVVQSTLSFSDSITMESTHSDSTRSNTSGNSNSNSSSSTTNNMFNNDDDDYSTMDNTNEGSAISERNTPYTLTNTKYTQTTKCTLLSSQSMIATNTAELQSITMRKEEATLHLEELASNIQQATATYHQLTITNNQLQVEIQKTQEVNVQLLNERNKLMGEIEIYKDQIEVHNLLSQTRNENVILTNQVEELQLQLLKEKEKNALIMLPSQQGEVATTVIMIEEEEERDDDIDDDVNPNVNDDEARDDIEDPRGGCGNNNNNYDDDEYGRERTYTGGSDTVSALHESDTISVLFDQDFTSKQQQQQQQESALTTTSTSSSIKSEHDNIRLHAEKMLFWANRAEERSTKKKMKSSTNSVTSLTEESSSTMDNRNTATTNMLNNSISDDVVDPDGITGVTKPVTTTAVSVASSATVSAMIHDHKVVSIAQNEVYYSPHVVPPHRILPRQLLLLVLLPTQHILHKAVVVPCLVLVTRKMGMTWWESVEGMAVLFLVHSPSLHVVPVVVIKLYA
jgi:hypothetical protein